MAITNLDRVGKTLDLLKDGLAPFVEREMRDEFGKNWLAKAKEALSDRQAVFAGSAEAPGWDVAAILSLMWNLWNAVFHKTLGQAERTLVSELRDVRNRWAHQNVFTSDDAYRALDSAGRLLSAVSAPQAGEVEKSKMELLRARFDEQLRTEKRKSAGTAIESAAAALLKPWREVVTPHKDVASGRYQQAEFAADLWQVHLGEGQDEYLKPVEFFRRTFLTESLDRLLVGAVERLSGKGGDPVVQLQTNFGGGKTHSMLALYHLFSGAPPGDLPGIDAVMRKADVSNLPAVRRVVLVGNRISPGNPVQKPDGTTVRTLWGELAWQLGFAAGGAAEAKKAFLRVKADDDKATSPGDALREICNQYAPCVILIDEWVAYARQLHDGADLPGGSFETHFTFAQALSESAKLARQCLLVVSLPASESPTSPHTGAEDVEVGGERGRAALARLRNAIGRVETSWRPASAEEGFEIVRRRLFEPLAEKAQFVARDAVAREFHDLYAAQHDEFPPECRGGDYEQRLKGAYPIHPEVFDRLYNDWSTLVKFQRTRGVLRLMAAVIHSLWEKGDRNPLILPANLPIEDRRVQFELTRYLSETWVPVIEKDVDGPNALPLRLDGEIPTLGKFAACRRVARTIYLGSAPIAKAANPGIEDRRIKLGCVMPGESPSTFGDALRRLSAASTYLYEDGARYWYSTQATVAKVAEERADQLKRNPDKVAAELEKRVRADVRQVGDWSRVHPVPRSSDDVPDDRDARLVVLGIEHPFSKDPESPARVEAQKILESRGSALRRYGNTLAFLAVDQARLQDLDEAIRRYLAWESILADKVKLDLPPHQVKQAEGQRDSADQTVHLRLPEAYQWLLVPVQSIPQGPIEWRPIRLSGSDPLAVRAGKKLRNDGLLVTVLAGTALRIELDRVPLWRGDHVPIRQLAEDFARFVYLSRLKDPAVVAAAVRDGLPLITWERDSFAYADSFDEAAGRYRGLRFCQNVPVGTDDPGLLVTPEAARRQIAAEGLAGAGGGSPGEAGTSTPEARAAETDRGAAGRPATPPARPRRYHGSVALDPTRVGRDAGRAADEVIAHLAGLVGATVKVTLEIEAEVQSGVPENVVRTVTENSRTLKFTSHGFETA